MITALISILLNSIAQLALKKVSSGNFAINALIKNPYFYYAGFLYSMSIATWILTLRRIEVSLAFPLQSLGYVVVFFAGILVFKESWNRLSIIAMIFIVFGAVLLGKSKL